MLHQIRQWYRFNRYNPRYWRWPGRQSTLEGFHSDVSKIPLTNDTVYVGHSDRDTSQSRYPGAKTASIEKSPCNSSSTTGRHSNRRGCNVQNRASEEHIVPLLTVRNEILRNLLWSYFRATKEENAPFTTTVNLDSVKVFCEDARLRVSYEQLRQVLMISSNLNPNLFVLKRPLKPCQLTQQETKELLNHMLPMKHLELLSNERKTIFLEGCGLRAGHFRPPIQQPRWWE